MKRLCWLRYGFPVFCVFLVGGCATKRGQLAGPDCPVERERAVEFARQLDDALPDWISGYPWRFARMSDARHDYWYRPEVKGYLLDRSPRSPTYSQHGGELETALHNPRRVSFEPGAISDRITIGRSRRWREGYLDRWASPTHAVFGPIYYLDSTGEMITTVRFVVNGHHPLAYVWIGAHRLDEHGEWQIVEMANVSRPWTVYVAGGGPDPSPRATPAR